jgi:maleamate amidohydrolase
VNSIARVQRPQVWDPVIPAADRRIYEAGGFGGMREFGDNPCVLVIDVVGAFLGPRPGDPATSDDFMACGENGWARLPNIVGLVDEARAGDVPVVFLKGNRTAKLFCGGSLKVTADGQTSYRIHDAGFPAELAPREDEFVLEKSRPSAFFGTPLVAYLTRNRIDTLIVAGTTTSGCVRATVVDGAAHNYGMFVVEEACFDRSPFSHAVNMFEMQQKYADVVNLDDVREYFAARTPVSLSR